MNFDRLAPVYDLMEAVTSAGLLQRARTTWLDAFAGRRRILTVGEGHGRFLAACAARHPGAAIAVVEPSTRMLARARRRLAGRADRIAWHQEEILGYAAARPHDAVATCFFLDCFPAAQQAAVIRTIAGCLEPGAPWLVVDFALPARGPARWRARAIHALMYAFFRVAVGLPARRLTPPDGELAALGFRKESSRRFSWGLVEAAVWRRG